ncbi:Ras-related protein Rab-7b [Entamoeba marina]
MSKPKKTLLKMILIGDSSVGKSSLMNQFINKNFNSQYKATIGADFLTKEIDVDNQSIALQVWDTAGHEKFMSFGQAFYRGSDCCFLVFDVTNEISFKSLDTWKNEFLSGSNLTDTTDFPFVVMANKVDGDSGQRVISNDMIREWCDNNGNIPFYETSAKSGVNVDDAFITVAKKVVLSMKQDDDTTTPVSTINIEDKRDSSKGCC